MRKKFLCGVIATTLCLSLAACGKEDTKELPSNNNSSTIERSIDENVEEKENNNGEEVETSSNNEDESATESQTPQTDVTAESLINGIDNTKHQDETSHSTMIMDMDMSMELPDETGKTQTMSMSMYGDYTIVGNKNSAYVKGNVTVDSLGSKESQTQEAYSVLEDGVMITYQTTDGTNWTKSKDSSTNWDMTSSTSKLKTDYFTNLTLEDDGEEYVVKGDLDASHLNEMMVGDTSSIADTSSIDLSIPIPMEITFDKSSLEVTSMSFDMKDTMAASVAAYGMDIDKFYMSVRITEYTQETIEVPSDIKEKAVEVTISDEDEDFDFGDDTEEDTEETIDDTTSDNLNNNNSSKGNGASTPNNLNSDITVGADN